MQMLWHEMAVSIAMATKTCAFLYPVPARYFMPENERERFNPPVLF